MKKLLIGGVSIAALAGGSLAVASLSPIQLAGAKSAAPAIEMQAGQAPGTTQPGQPGQPGQRGRGNRGGLDKALEELVREGTISQEQADKIKEKLRSKGGGQPGRGRGQAAHASLEEIAKSIGITEEQLKTELKSGKSIAEVAQAHGVDPQKVINDLVALANTKIDQAVAAGKIPADRAAEAKSKVTERITELVNSKHGPKGDHPKRGKGGHGPDDSEGPEGPEAPDDDQDESPPPSTATPAPPTSPPTTAAPATTAPTTAAPTPSTRGAATGGTTGTTAG